MVIDDKDFVGQEKHHIALVVGALKFQVDGFELKGDVIAEGAVKPQLVVIAGEQLLQRPVRWRRSTVAVNVLLH